MTAAAATTPVDFGLPITPEQRKALFAIGKARGRSIDDLRDLTPAGSISALTRLQTARLLESLNAGTPYRGSPRRSRTPRHPKGVFAIATPAQRNKIEALRIDLGWTPDGLAGFLHDRRHTDGRRMTRIDGTTDAAAVIELLKAVLVKSRQAQDRRDSEADRAAGASEHRQGQAQDEHREVEADGAVEVSERQQDQVQGRRESERDAAAIASEHRPDQPSRQDRREGPTAALGATEGASPIGRPYHDSPALDSGHDSPAIEDSSTAVL